jgi:hypothetical protein
MKQKIEKKFKYINQKFSITKEKQFYKKVMRNGEDKIWEKHSKIMEAKKTKMKYIRYTKKT